MKRKLNTSHRVAVFGMKKADPIEVRAAARFAIAERPEPAAEVPAELRTLRDIAGRLEAHARTVTRLVMSQRGNDLVRRYLWMAALTAIEKNPAVRALYQRRAATLQEGQKGIALGHAMRKLLHQVWGVWTSGRPYNPQHETPPARWAADPCADSATPTEPSCDSAATAVAEASPETSEAAGGNRELCPEKQAVTAASSPSVATCPRNDHSARRVAHECSNQAGGGAAPSQPHGGAGSPRRGPWIDFAQLRRQLPLERVLRDTGHLPTLKGSGPQRRGPCPLHAAPPRWTWSNASAWSRPRPRPGPATEKMATVKGTVAGT